MLKKPAVTISLKPYLADYCRFIFVTDKEGTVILNRRIDIGKRISSEILISDLPVRRPFISNPATFILPITKNNHYALYGRFYYISKWGEEKIQDYIEAEFRQRVRLLFEEGYKRKYNQKEIIEAILRGFNIRNNSLNFESVKKIDYRNERKTEEMRFKELLTAI
jgi:hypothetical protein